MKLKEKLRNKLKKWLFADEIQRINYIEKILENQYIGLGWLLFN